MYYNTDKTTTPESLITIFAVIFIIICCLVNLFSCSDSVSNERTVIGTVTDKEVKRQDESSDIYLIYTKDEQDNVQVLMIDDSLLLGHFNSSDLYAEIEIDKTYEFVVTGSRNQALSWYPNIHSINEISTDDVKGGITYE